MANEKEILAHFFKGDSQRTIAAVLRISRNTVTKIVKAYHEQQLEADAVGHMDSETLHRHLFPEDVALPVQVQPDYARVHKELLKSGVTLKKPFGMNMRLTVSRLRRCISCIRSSVSVTATMLTCIVSPCIFFTSLVNVSWSTGLAPRCPYTIQKQTP